MSYPRKLKSVTTLCITAAILATGCATQDQKPVTVYIPVVASKPALPARPILPLSSITEQSSYAEVMQSYALTVKILQGYAEQIEVICK